MTEMGLSKGCRVLIVDDNAAIHDDFRKILGGASDTANALEAAEEALFGTPKLQGLTSSFRLDSAYQGEEALEKVQAAVDEGAPYALAFVDMRMPPGWGGIETIQHLWKVAPDLQIVICTAYSDYSWHEITDELGESDNFVILRKPFDNIEVLQLAHALTKKWVLSRASRARLEESEARFQQVFSTSPVAIEIATLAEGRIIDVNEAYSEMFGFERDEVVGRKRSSIGIWPDADARSAVLRGLDAPDGVRGIQCSLLTRSGEKRDVLVSAESLPLDGVPCALLTIHDVSERVRLEEQLRQSQKMEAVGQLAAGIAHDFNNILTLITGHAHVQLMRAEVDQGALESLRHISEAAHTAGELTRRLLTFSRRHIVEARPTDLNEVVDSSIKMIERLVEESIQLDRALAPDMPPVRADENLVEQVLINLAVNARDAMPGGGRLLVSTQPTVVEGRETPKGCAPGQYVRMSVQDSGTGISDAVKSRIFEPFFTTKEPGRGTGLGLATVYGIAEQHGGWVEVDSTMGVGTTFHVFLPISGDAAVTTPAKAPVTPLRGGKETILLVEDQKALRDLLKRVLLGHGYEIIEAESGAEAAEIWERKSAEIDLLLTDMVMPGGVSGRDLAKQCLAQDPDLVVILSSGYSVDLHDVTETVGDVSVLQKPYQPAALVRIVRELLDKRSSGRASAVVEADTIDRLRAEITASNSTPRNQG